MLLDEGRRDALLEVAAPRVGVQLGWRSWLTICLSSLVGGFAFAWPLLMPPSGVSAQHATDAPFLFAFLMPMILILAVAQVSDGGLDAKSLSMLGVLTAINAALRPVLGTGVAGMESVFFLLILAGRVFGPGFGYVMGLTSLFTSALLTAGIGPWLPFQMLAAAWVGLGAGLLPRSLGRRAEIAVLALYGALSAYVYGLLMNLWFWPFMSGIHVDGHSGGSLDFVAGAPMTENLVRFLWFSAITSTAGWDTGRAITTAVAVILVGPALLVVLRRAAVMGRVSS